MLVVFVVVALSVHFVQAERGSIASKGLKLFRKLNVLQVQTNNSRVPVEKFQWISGKIAV